MNHRTEDFPNPQPYCAFETHHQNARIRVERPLFCLEKRIWLMEYEDLYAQVYKKGKNYKKDIAPEMNPCYLITNGNYHW